MAKNISLAYEILSYLNASPVGVRSLQQCARVRLYVLLTVSVNELFPFKAKP